MKEQERIHMQQKIVERREGKAREMEKRGMKQGNRDGNNRRENAFRSRREERRITEGQTGWPQTNKNRVLIHS